MFAGLTSRWTIPLACAKSSASATCAMMSPIWSNGERRPCARTSFRFCPSTYSIAMNDMPVVSS